MYGGTIFALYPYMYTQIPNQFYNFTSCILHCFFLLDPTIDPTSDPTMEPTLNPTNVPVFDTTASLIDVSASTIVENESGQTDKKRFSFIFSVNFVAFLLLFFF